jgi:hypothetical protein
MNLSGLRLEPRPELHGRRGERPAEHGSGVWGASFFNRSSMNACSRLLYLWWRSCQPPCRSRGSAVSVTGHHDHIGCGWEPNRPPSGRHVDRRGRDDEVSTNLTCFEHFRSPRRAGAH